MNTAVKTFETLDYTYKVTYTRTAKTTYDQQEERKQERNYMLVQKALGVSLIAIGIISSLILKDATASVLPLMFGLPISLTYEHVIG